ncbi:MAG: 30S ribosomal protein S17 [Candidatus Pacearchaeota archaeon]|nr:30S ribosomal protein S17 [Candidatus Pacearchaeota archaeon]
MRKVEESTTVDVSCDDKKCPIHGSLSVRGRYFEGKVEKIVGRRVVIVFERLIYFRKYERFAKASTRIHAYLPKCLLKEIKLGDTVQVGECRPLSKMVHFSVVKKIK